MSKSSFCKAMFGFEQVQISSSASIVAMYSIISTLHTFGAQEIWND